MKFSCFHDSVKKTRFDSEIFFRRITTRERGLRCVILTKTSRQNKNEFVATRTAKIRKRALRTDGRGHFEQFLLKA